jgi:hypothetical protein
MKSRTIRCAGTPQGRPKPRWENDIKNDLKEMKLNNWRICIQDRNKWKRVIEKTKKSLKKKKKKKKKKKICGDM